MKTKELTELEEMLDRQIKRRDKQIQVNGFPSKKITDQISKTRLLISMEEKKVCPHCGKCDMNYDTDGSYLNWECQTFP